MQTDHLPRVSRETRGIHELVWNLSLLITAVLIKPRASREISATCLAPSPCAMSASASFSCALQQVDRCTRRVYLLLLFIRRPRSPLFISSDRGNIWKLSFWNYFVDFVRATATRELWSACALIWEEHSVGYEYLRCPVGTVGLFCAVDNLRVRWFPLIIPASNPFICSV